MAVAWGKVARDHVVRAAQELGDLGFTVQARDHRG
jgi:hypothetical protein